MFMHGVVFKNHGALISEEKSPRAVLCGFLLPENIFFCFSHIKINPA
jgi:hypothetical protein